jgi:hypothetical protein
MAHVRELRDAHQARAARRLRVAADHIAFHAVLEALRAELGVVLVVFADREQHLDPTQELRIGFFLAVEVLLAR